jgi:hypothetical protein
MCSCLLSIGKFCTTVKPFDSRAANGGAWRRIKGDTAEGSHPATTADVFHPAPESMGEPLAGLARTVTKHRTRLAESGTCGADPGHRQMQRLIAVLQVPHSAFLLREPPAPVRQGRQVPTPMQILQIVEILYIHSILEILESE